MQRSLFEHACAANAIRVRDSRAMGRTPVPPPIAQFAPTCGVDSATFRCDRPGMSAFVREGDEVYHTYSTYARGLDGLWGAYQCLDRAPRGRNEQGIWWRRRDVQVACFDGRVALQWLR